MLRAIAEALGIFAVSMIVLFGFYTVITKNATGPFWWPSKGYVLIVVGVFYLVCGAILTRWHP